MLRGIVIEESGNLNILRQYTEQVAQTASRSKQSYSHFILWYSRLIEWNVEP